MAMAMACCAPDQKPSASPIIPARRTGSNNPAQVHAAGKVTTVSFEDFYALHESNKVLLYDARLAFFHNLGHIPGSINVPKNSGVAAVAAREAEIKAALAHGKTIVTYCTGTTCEDARTLANQIAALGYPVAVFTGGWHAWQDAEMPAE